MSPSTGNDKSDSHVELGDRQDELEVVPGPVLTLDLDLDVPTVDQTELDAAETEEDYIYILSVFWHFLVRFRSHSDPDAAVVARVKTHVEYVFTVWKQRHAESFHWWHKKMKLKLLLRKSHLSDDEAVELGHLKQDEALLAEVKAGCVRS